MRALPSRATYDDRSRRAPARLRGVRVLAALGLSLAVALNAVAAVADEDEVPTRAEVEAAEQRAVDRERDVAAVQADLIRANLDLETASVAAAQAAEAYNGATWRADEARAAADAAEQAAAAAQAESERQRSLYAQTVLTSLERSPGLDGVSALL